jgi:Protein of unknown function (DUF2971)
MPEPTVIPSEMRAALDKFRDEAEGILASFLRSLDSTPPPAIIYHYTDDAGLKGILETGKVWLSDIFSLNDPSELSHGFSIFAETLKTSAASGPPEARLFANSMDRFLERLRDTAQYFSCSFSADGDDLGQWRAYADNGHGYALGFNATLLESSFEKQSQGPIPNTASFPITYKDAKLAAIHSDLVSRVFNLISLPRGRKLSDAVVNAYMGELAVMLASHAMHACLFFKHPSYKNEQEYRFLKVCEAGQAPVGMKTRMRPYRIVEYIEFDWKGNDSDALKRIVVGPAADSEKATRFAKDCLRMFSSGAVSVDGSKIPYRGT